jgi:hypothetical protein
MAGLFVPENANNGRGAGRNVARMGPFVPENARRANNRTRRTVRLPMGIYVPENAGANARPATRALPTTPGYGQLDLRAIKYDWKGGSSGLKVVAAGLTGFINTGLAPRYIIAYVYKGGLPTVTGSGHGISTVGPMPTLILIDNHGQRHEFRSGAYDKLLFAGGAGIAGFRELVDNVKYPVPLPDILIDQIKLNADMQNDKVPTSVGPQIPNWDPVANINTLRAAL